MSAKRPRPAIPVLVHVDNPAEVGSVTVDVSTIEGKMDTVINNQNRIYDKIPTSTGGGGGSADLTTVNEKITTLATAIGPASSTSADDNIFGYVRNLHFAVGDTATIPSISDTSVRGLLTAIKQNTASGGSGGGGSADLTTVNNKITALAETIGSVDSTYEDNNLIGRVKNLALSAGEFGGSLSITGTGLRSLLYNVRQTIGDFNDKMTLNDTSVRSMLYNIRTAIGSGSATPTLTGTSVRDLLTQIKENTASGGGGGGGSADLTTVNEKTTALAAAIGSASDDSSTVSVIGLLKSITDKY